MKIDKVYLRRQYGSTHIVPGKTLAKVFEAIDGNLCIILARIIRVKPWSECSRHVGKYNIMWTIRDFDKNWSSFPNWTKSTGQ